MLCIDEEWIEPLTYGSIFFGSGGGGSTRAIARELKNAIKGKRIELFSLEEVPDQGRYCGVANIGSPEVMRENLPTGWEGKTAIERLEGLCGCRFDGITVVEGAGVNVLYPLMTALRTGLPLVDADSMGRAYPELQMTTYHLHGLPASPFVLVDGFGQVNSFETGDTFLLELNTRQVIGSRGGVGYFAAFASTGDMLKRVLIPGAVSRAWEIGRIFCQASSYQELLDRVIEATRNSLYGPVIELFVGQVERISEVESMKWRTINLVSRDGEFQILLQYENLIAYKNRQLAGIVPDLLIFIDVENLIPVNNNEVRPGDQLAVWGLPALLTWRIKRSLDLVGPHCFGYRSPYIPLERLYPDYYYPGEGI